MQVFAPAISNRNNPHAIEAEFFQGGQMKERVSSEAREVVDENDIECLRRHVDCQSRRNARAIWLARAAVADAGPVSQPQSFSSRIQTLRKRTGLLWSWNISGPLSACGV